MLIKDPKKRPNVHDIINRLKGISFSLINRIDLINYKNFYKKTNVDQV